MRDAGVRDHFTLFPRSAWELKAPPLCGALAPNATQSVAVVRSHAERGNEKFVILGDIHG